MANSRAFIEARSHLPTQEEIDAALSARYTEKDRKRAEEKALAAGFDAVPEQKSQPVPRETTETKPSPVAPKWPIEHPVARFGLPDFPSWGPWLIGELQKAWPQMSGVNFASVMRVWSASNEHLFVRTSNAAALSVSVPHPLIGGATVVRGIFCWSRFPEEKGAELHLVQLHRSAIDWAKSRRALRFEVFEKSDLVGGRVDFFVRPMQQVLRYVETRQ